MIQLLELENKNVILFNDENITEEEVIKLLNMGEYSSHYIVMTGKQYENIFKPKNSIIKEFKKECLNTIMERLIQTF